MNEPFFTRLCQKLYEIDKEVDEKILAETLYAVKEVPKNLISSDEAQISWTAKIYKTGLKLRNCNMIYCGETGNELYNQHESAHYYALGALNYTIHKLNRLPHISVSDLMFCAGFYAGVNSKKAQNPPHSQT